MSVHLPLNVVLTHSTLKKNGVFLNYPARINDQKRYEFQSVLAKVHGSSLLTCFDAEMALTSQNIRNKSLLSPPATATC